MFNSNRSYILLEIHLLFLYFCFFSSANRAPDKILATLSLVSNLSIISIAFITDVFNSNMETDSPLAALINGINGLSMFAF